MHLVSLQDAFYSMVIHAYVLPQWETIRKSRIRGGIQVNVYKFLKQLKKKLKWRRRWITLSLFLIVITCWLAAYRLHAEVQQSTSRIDAEVQSAFVPATDSADMDIQNKALEVIRSLKIKQAVYLQTVFVCGEETQQLGVWSSSELQAAHKKHPNWLIRMNEPGKVTFIQHVEDLSPDCKAQAYFGMDEDGSLSLFNGVPGKDNVIRTFFQLNIDYLESSLPKETVKELRDGIRVTDMAEYNSVLSTFSEYAVEASSRAISP
jgi:forespore regulator of the sigma-K checkpoint